MTVEKTSNKGIRTAIINNAYKQKVGKAGGRIFVLAWKSLMPSTAKKKKRGWGDNM
jgi:hypothetical protein